MADVRHSFHYTVEYANHGTRWVLTDKQHKDGTPKAKACLVGRGFQDVGVEDLLTVSPTAGKTSWRMIISACVIRNWIPHTVEM